MEKVSDRLFKEVVEKDILYDMDTLLRDIGALKEKLVEIQIKIDIKQGFIDEGVKLGIKAEIVEPKERIL